VWSRRVRSGEVVLTFRGPLLRKDQIGDFTHCLEVGPDRFLGPSGGPDDYVNHGCDPNCAIELDGQTPLLRAIRDIARGEEIVYDYSTSMVSDPTSFECRCGAATCRGVVHPFRTLPPALRRRYEQRGMVPAFVIRGGLAPTAESSPVISSETKDRKP
jgi:hypothetical protein